MFYPWPVYMFTKKIVALSLIEIMWVIVVFAIGIIAVVRLLSHNILIAQLAHHRSQATMIAKEKLEMLYTFRDTNKKKWFPRNCVTMNAWGINTLVDENVCASSMIPQGQTWWYWQIVYPSGNTQHITLLPVSETYTGSYIYISQMSGMTTNTILSGRIYAVSSYVPYMYGVATGEVVIQSFLADI